MRPILVNAGPLIALGKLNRLHLLVDLYEVVQVPRAVYREVVVDGIAQGQPDAVSVRLFLTISGLPIVEASEEVLRSYSPRVTLGAGERELLSLARDQEDALVLLDDAEARTEARHLGLAAKGTLGILVEAWRAGLLSSEEIELLLLEIANRPDIWISEKLCRQVLEQLLHQGS